MFSVNDDFQAGKDFTTYKLNLSKSPAPLTIDRIRGAGTGSILPQGDSEPESPVTKRCCPCMRDAGSLPAFGNERAPQLMSCPHEGFFGVWATGMRTCEEFSRAVLSDNSPLQCL